MIISLIKKTFEYIKDLIGRFRIVEQQQQQQQQKIVVALPPINIIPLTPNGWGGEREPIFYMDDIESNHNKRI